MLSAEEKMRPNAPPPPEYQRQYAATKIVRLFKTLKRLEFSGQVIWHEGSAGGNSFPSQGQKWVVFLEKGNLRYGTGGSHPVRRWQRHLIACCPHLSDLSSRLLGQANGGNGTGKLAQCWEYQQLDRLLQQQQITLQNHTQIVEQILIELLFDISQAEHVSHRLQRYPARSAELPLTPLPKLAEDKIFASVESQWRQWFDAKLGSYSPNLAPIICQPDALRAETSPQVFQILMSLMDGRHTLRDLAVKTHRAVQPFMQVLLPYVLLGWIELLETPDAPLPNVPIHPVNPAEPPPLIACIDDSLMICQSMEQVMRAAGYRFIAITEPSRAIATVLAKKPDIIFLDLIMPETNGYEICSQLRKVSRFKDTPIIILTGNDGIVDQVRARLLGATDFLSKPMEPAVILSIIQRLAKQKV